MKKFKKVKIGDYIKVWFNKDSGCTYYGVVTKFVDKNEMDIKILTCNKKCSSLVDKTLCIGYTDHRHISFSNYTILNNKEMEKLMVELI